MVCRRTGWDGVAGKLARHALAIHLENAATLALAFCHAHQLAVQDFVRFEKLEGWDEAAAALGTAVQPLDDLLELMKQNVSEQVHLGVGDVKSCTEKSMSQDQRPENINTTSISFATRVADQHLACDR